jgi:hypothetical protein
MASVSYGRLLRENPNFRLFWFGQIVSQLGDWFNFFLLQHLAEDRYRDRVFAAEASLFTGTMVLSNLFTAQALDSRHAEAHLLVAVLGLISLAIGGGWTVGCVLAGFRGRNLARETPA